MKHTLKKVFSGISSAEYKTVPAIKVEVETANFNWYQSCKKQKIYLVNKTNPIDRQGKIMCCFECNLMKPFAQDCTSFSSTNDSNTIMDSNQVHFTLSNVDSHY